MKSHIFPYRNDQLYIEEIPLKELAQQYGTPLYIYSKTALVENFQTYKNALKEHPHHICYAVKANGNLAILSTFAKLGAGFDIVSRGELERVLAAGGDPKKVNPVVPVDLVIDHSVQVDFFATPEALQRNTEMEFYRNRERYEFLKWGQSAFSNFRVVPPMTGIVSQRTFDRKRELRAAP